MKQYQLFHVSKVQNENIYNYNSIICLRVPQLSFVPHFQLPFVFVLKTIKLLINAIKTINWAEKVSKWSKTIGELVINAFDSGGSDPDFLGSIWLF